MRSDRQSFFIFSSKQDSTGSPVASDPARLYALNLAGSFVRRNLASQLICYAEIAFGRRDPLTLERFGQALLSLPQPKYQQAGMYYIATSARLCGLITEARVLLEQVAHGPDPVHRARALQSLGAIHYEASQNEEAEPFYIAAAHASVDTDPLTFLNSHWQFTALESVRGNHKKALQDLGDLWPLIRALSRNYPHLFFAFHNDIAFELGQVGTFEEASKHSAIACNSPFAEKYPEWKETYQCITQRQQASQHKPVIIIVQKPESEPESKPAVVIPVPIICFHPPKSYNIDLRGSIYLSHAPASILQLECIKYSITRRGPPLFSLL